MPTPTANSTPHSLPAIPTLPPIKMNDESDRDSFHSHHSSLSATPLDGTFPIATRPAPLALPSSTHHPPQQNLRKSVSVDSFISYERENSSTSSTSRPPRATHAPTGSSGIRRTDLSVDSARRYDAESLPLHVRTRGMSMSARNDGHDSAVEQNFESESWQPLRKVGDKSRWSSVKCKEQARQSRRPGDLKLPARNQSPAVPVNNNNIPNQYPQPVLRDDTRRLHSTTSLQSFSRHSSLTDVISGRVRSGSLGLQVNSGGRSSLTDMVQPMSFPKEISIAVVGTPGCGKSTFVSEDARAYGVEDFTALFAMSGSSISTPFRYSRRLDWVKQREPPNVSIVIHELDITRLTSPPRVDGIFVCYDSGDVSSLGPVSNFLRLIRPMKCSIIAVALKSDLPVAVDPQTSLSLFQQHDVGLVQVNHVGDIGKMRKAFKFLLMSILRVPNTDLRNPASPGMLLSPSPFESRGSASATPTASSSVPSVRTTSQASSFRLSPISNLPSSPPPLATSPTRARSTSDLFAEHEKARSHTLNERKLSNARSVTNLVASNNPLSPSVSSSQPVKGDTLEDDGRPKGKEPRSVQYATLDELLDKLLFLAVSGDDPTFIAHFLLTYRRFASPRSILLAMQKRMRQLDNSLGDPMFASYAQMRICHLLETWVHTYPQDFAAPGAAGALSALVKSVIGKTYLLHYGSDFLSFLEHLPNIIDSDSAWAHKADHLLDDADDPYSISDGEDESLAVTTKSALSNLSSAAPTHGRLTGSNSRERTQSLPLSAKALIMPITSSHPSDVTEISPRQLLKELYRQSLELQNYDCSEIAEEITRVEAKLFMEIEPRHWLRYTLIPGRKDPESDSISRFNAISNHLADWVVSLILCHDKPKNRAKQIEKFVDIAHKLRALNNYSALRAFVAGINNSTFQGDDTMEMFKSKTPDHYKNLLSWDVLLQHRGAHQAYRMALKNTKGACIPALEVHMSDLIRAHEGNPDFSASEANKIHWGKFNMFGRFIQSTTHCQLQCQTTSDYNFLERPKIRNLVFNEYVMPEEMQVSRMAPVSDSEVVDEPFRPSLPRSISRDDGLFTQGRDTALIRRLFQW
ncbi:ras guanine nucleotide exchange factor domain-containing protein [Boletus edulis BED1]|uniref:Ras guanine nucleotide exchange factor domain-containing protein n=1 Tax=Boletus edulis BED1 TaxID=1328754 RepID=A0AAD4C1B6_BOLED|nr:ras guanine nucleotide exchange factor domain-containing protein [Boletus edulis BED1]